MAGPYSAAFFGFINTFGNTAGFLSSQVMGFLIDGKDLTNPSSWFWVYTIPSKYRELGSQPCYKGNIS